MKSTRTYPTPKKKDYDVPAPYGKSKKASMSHSDNAKDMAISKDISKEEARAMVSSIDAIDAVIRTGKYIWTHIWIMWMAS